MLSTFASLRTNLSNRLHNSAKGSPLSRAEDRRLREVEQSPEIAVGEDVHLLLIAHGVVGERLRHTCLALEQLPVSPPVIWRWITEHDGVELAELLGAGLSCYDLVEHLVLMTLPQDLPHTVVLAS